MTEEKLCASGHVIDAGRETCSRCNGAPVNAEAPVEATDEVVTEVAPEVAAEEVVADEVPATEEVAPEAEALVAEVEGEVVPEEAVV